MRVVWLRLSEAGFAIGVWAMNRLPDEPMTEAQRARMEPFERGVWMIVGVFLTAIAAGVLWATAQAGAK